MSIDPWNKGKLIGQKRPLKIEHVWAIRVRLEVMDKIRDLALFNLAIDSKLRAFDLVSLSVNDVCSGGKVRARTQIIQRKTKQPVQFEITRKTRETIEKWLQKRRDLSDFLFPSRCHRLQHISYRRYHRLVAHWLKSIGLDSSDYGTHSLRRTKVAQIYKETKFFAPFKYFWGILISKVP